MTALARLRDRNAHAASLACFASIASHVEPELLRALRLALLPQADVSAEADLWWSRLVDLRAADSVRFSALALPELHAELAAKPAGLAAAYRVLHRMHRDAPDLARLQEWLTFRALASPGHHSVTSVLRKILGTLLAGGDAADDVAGWLGIASPRLPRALHGNPLFWSVVFTANARGRGSALDEVPPPEAMGAAGTLALDALASAGDTELVVRRDGDKLLLRALSEIANPGGLLVPRVPPIVVEVRSQRAAQVTMVRPHEWSAVEVSGAATVIALDGRTYELRSRSIAAPAEPIVRLPQLAPGDFDRGIAVRRALEDPSTRAVVITGRTGSARDTTISAWFERARPGFPARGVVVGLALEEDSEDEWRAFETSASGLFRAGDQTTDLAQRIDANQGLLILTGISRAFKRTIPHLAQLVRQVCLARSARIIVAMAALPDELRSLDHLVHIDLTEMDIRLVAMLDELFSQPFSRWYEQLRRFGDDTVVEVMLAAAELLEARPAPPVLVRWSDCPTPERAEAAARELGAAGDGFAAVGSAAQCAAQRDSGGIAGLWGPLFEAATQRLDRHALLNAIIRRLSYGESTASRPESAPHDREPAVWIHNVSASAGTGFELVGSPAVTRGDLVVAFVKEPRLRPLGIYEVVTGRRFATTDNNAAAAIGTRVTCQRVLELPVPHNEALDRARRELEALASSTSQRDTRNLGIHDRLLTALRTLFGDDVEVKTALEYLLTHPLTADAFVVYRERRLDALRSMYARDPTANARSVAHARKIEDIARRMPSYQVIRLWRETARRSFAAVHEGIGLCRDLEQHEVEEIDRVAARDKNMYWLHEHLLHHPNRGRHPPPTTANEAPEAQGAAPARPAAGPDEGLAVRRVVALDIADPEALAAAETAIASSPLLRIAGPDEATTPLANLRITGGALTIEDARGPLFPAMRFPEQLSAAVETLTNLARAQSIRELEGEHGVAADQVDIEIGTVENGRPHRLPDHGGELGLEDKLYVQITSRAKRPLYAHVLNIGLRGKVSILTSSLAPAGVQLVPDGPPFVLGHSLDGTLRGLGLSWPSGLPTEGQPRIDELVVFVTKDPIDLRGLETVEPLVMVGPGAGRAGSSLRDLLATGRVGSRDVQPEPAQVEPERAGDGYLMKRLSFLLHPRNEALGGLGFAIYEAGSALDTRSQGAPDADPASREPERVGNLAVRIAAFVVESPPPELGTGIRLDALICTRTTEAGDGYRTHTARFSNLKAGERVPLDHLFVFHGPVRDFVDISLFVSRNTEASLDLAAMLAARRENPEIEAAIRALRSPGDVAGSPIPAIGSKISLVRLAHQLLRQVTGHSIGLFSGLFLPRDRFGIGRHPVEGLYRTPGFSFALSIDSGERVAAA